MRTIGALIFEGFELLDLFGPLEMFGMLRKEFQPTLLGETVGPIQSGQRVSACAERTIYEATDYDILLVPGGSGTRREVGNARLLDQIAKISEKTELTFSVCTGSALLAKAGVWTIAARRPTKRRLPGSPSRG